MIIPFCGPTYEGRSKNFDTSRCINFYPEAHTSKDANYPLCLVGTPGTKPFLTFSAGNIRLMYKISDRMYIVVGSNIYRVYEDGTRSGILATFPSLLTGDIFAADNNIAASGFGGSQILMIEEGGSGYIFDVSNNSLTKITDANFPATPQSVTCLDMYFVVSDGSMLFYTSELPDNGGGLTWLWTARATATGTSDNISRIVSLNEQLYVIKSWSTEIWTNSGNPTSLGPAFVRQQSAILPFGTPAPKSIAYGIDTIFFLANQGNGNASCFAGVAALQGYSPVIISTPPINYRISQMNTISDARGYVYLSEGHSFYVLTFPTEDVTLCFDITTQMWHERSTYNYIDSLVHRHLSQNYVFFGNKHLVSDYRSPIIHEMSSKYYTDNGYPIVSTRIAQAINDRSNSDSIFIHRFIVEMESGVGNYDNPPETIDPSAQLSWSNDDGHTWSNRYISSIGKIGEYKKRLIWNRLGKARNRVFKLTISDAIKKVVLGAYINDGARR